MLRTDMQNIITAIKQISHDHKLREARKMYQRKVKRQEYEAADTDNEQ